MKMLTGKRIGFAVTGSFCTFKKAFAEAEALVQHGAELTPIFSANAAGTDTRFGKAADHIRRMEEIAGRRALLTIAETEPLGPKDMLDAIVVAPCTSNTLAKLALGIVDTSVTMAVKSMLRGGKPIIVAAATNDALRCSAKNIGLLLNAKHYYFVPIGQDAPEDKPASMVADFTRIAETVKLALDGRQIQPLIIQKG